MTEPVFIIDTNIVVSGLITATNSSPVAQILDRMLTGELVYVVSPALLNEYRSVLLRPKLMRLHRLKEAQIEDLLVELTANAIWHEPGQTGAVPVLSALSALPAPDRGDDHLWAILTAHASRILVTGDQLLLNNPPERSSVISPATYLNEFVMLGGAAH